MFVTLCFTIITSPCFSAAKAASHSVNTSRGRSPACYSKSFTIFNKCNIPAMQAKEAAAPVRTYTKRIQFFLYPESESRTQNQISNLCGSNLLLSLPCSCQQGSHYTSKHRYLDINDDNNACFPTIFLSMERNMLRTKILE